MKNYIAKEGYLNIVVVSFLFLFCWIFYGFSLLLFILLLMFVFIYRQTDRKPACLDQKAILSPIDGKIIKIENFTDKELGECVEIRIKNAFYNQGVVYAPFDMRIIRVQVRHGLFLCSEFKAAQTLNERVCILSNHNYKVAMNIQAGSFDRGIKLYNGRELKSCDKMCFFFNGCVSLILPKQTRIYCGLGDELKAGSLLGYFA